MKVNFERLHWENYPSLETPVNADNLNRLEEGVAGLYSDVAEIEEELSDGVGEYVTGWLDDHVTPTGSAVIVDDTLTIQGAAADAKKTGDEISDLKDDLTAVEDDVADLKDGLNSIIQTVTWDITTAPTVDNVLWTVSTGNTYKVENSTSELLSFRFVDASNTILQEKNISANTTVTVVSTVNADHIRMFVNGIGKITVTSLDSMLGGLENDVEILKSSCIVKDDVTENIFVNKVEYSGSDFTLSPGYINAWGQIANASGSLGYTYTNQITLKKGDKIIFESDHVNYANVCVIAVYVTTGRYTPLVMGINGSGSYQYVVTFDGDYAFSFADNTKITIISQCVIDSEIDSLKNQTDYLTLFKNVVCLGDSLTRGYNTTYPEGQRNRDFGYPWVLARETNLNVYNYGHSGATPTTLYTELSNVDFSLFDMAVICLGRNGGLSSTEDQTNYQNLISKLLTDNEHMTIFICSLPANGDIISASDVSTNERIQAIATSNGLPYLDLWGTYGSNKYRTGDAHFNPVGYILLAQTIMKKINEYIDANLSEYLNLWMPNTLSQYINGKVE